MVCTCMCAHMHEERGDKPAFSFPAYFTNVISDIRSHRAEDTRTEERAEPTCEQIQVRAACPERSPVALLGSSTLHGHCRNAALTTTAQDACSEHFCPI